MNEGLGVTSSIFDGVALGTSYPTPVVLTPKGAAMLVLTIDISAGDATSVQVRVRSRNDKSGSYVDRIIAEQSFTLGAPYASNRGNFRMVVDDIASAEGDLDVSIKRTGGAAATATLKARFDRTTVPLLS